MRPLLHVAHVFAHIDHGAVEICPNLAVCATAMHRRLADSGALILLMPLPRILPFFDLPRTNDCACVKIRGSPPVVLQVLHMTGKGSCPTKYLLSGRVSLRPGALSRGPKAFIEGQALNGHRGRLGFTVRSKTCTGCPLRRGGEVA